MLVIRLRFRTHKYGIVTDIEKAFHHFNLHAKERDFTRFLWLFDLIWNIYHLEHFNSPVKLDMKKNMYVDNVISAVNCHHEERTIINDAKFNLRSWASNCSALQDVATQKRWAKPRSSLDPC